MTLSKTQILQAYDTLLAITPDPHPREILSRRVYVSMMRNAARHNARSGRWDPEKELRKLARIRAAVYRSPEARRCRRSGVTSSKAP